MQIALLISPPRNEKQHADEDENDDTHKRKPRQ
jgi:hypothetical protein